MRPCDGILLADGGVKVDYGTCLSSGEHACVVHGSDLLRGLRPAKHTDVDGKHSGKYNRRTAVLCIRSSQQGGELVK